MVTRIVLVLSALGIVFGSVAGLLTGLTLPAHAREWLGSSPWRFGFIFGGVGSVICLTLFLVLMAPWPRFRRFIEGPGTA